MFRKILIALCLVSFASPVMAQTVNLDCYDRKNTTQEWRRLQFSLDLANRSGELIFTGQATDSFKYEYITNQLIVTQNSISFPWDKNRAIISRQDLSFDTGGLSGMCKIVEDQAPKRLF